mgnify:CR=1 FL=1
MPDRIIRDQARRSPTLQRLSDAAERAWWRLTIYHDDYGRFEADPEVLLAGLMVRRPSGWTMARMQKVVAEWADQADPLIHLYQVPGDLRIYGHVINTTKHQRERESKPKYPDPPCGNLPQDAAKCRESLQLAAYSESRESVSTESREPRAEILCPPQVAAWPSPEALVAKYNHETPKECPAVKALPNGRLLSAGRMQKAKKYLGLFPQEEFWSQVFAQVHKSKFLRGLKPSLGHEHFAFDFDWMLSCGKNGAENCVKVREGKYADGAR